MSPIDKLKSVKGEAH